MALIETARYTIPDSMPLEFTTSIKSKLIEVHANERTVVKKFSKDGKIEVA